MCSLKNNFQRASLIIGFALFLFVANTMAQLTGYVVDKQTNEPLIGATVQLNQSSTVTDIDGKFIFDQILDSYPVVLSYLGYETLVVELSAGEHQLQMVTASNLLEQAVISSSRYKTRQSESTVSLAVMKPDKLQSMNTSSIDQALDLVPGVDVIDGQANIRGGSGYAYGAGSRVLLVIDNMPALQFDRGYAQWSDVPTENIAQVEVLKGASSVLYGASALNGVIHMITQEATAQPSTKIGITYRHFFKPEDERRAWWGKSETPYEVNGHIVHRRKVKDLGIVVGAFYNQLRSYNQHTSEYRGRVYTKFNYKLNSKSRFRLNMYYNYVNNSSFFFWGNALRRSFQPGEGTISKRRSTRFNIDPTWTYFASNDVTHKLQGRWYYSDNKNSGNQSIKSQFQYLNYSIVHPIINSATKLQSGVEMMANQTFSELYGNSKYNGYNLAAYSQLDQRINERFSYQIGARYEWNSIKNDAYSFQQDSVYEVSAGTSTQSKPIFRFGMVYNPMKSTFLRASIGQGYRYSSIAEKFTATSVGGLSIVPNPKLLAEVGWSAEVGIRQLLKVGNVSGFLDAAVFYSEYDDMIEFTLSPNFTTAFQAQNIGDTQILGSEVALGVEWKIGKAKLSALLSYVYIDPKYRNFTDDIRRSGTSDDNILKYRYRHAFKGQVSLDFFGFNFQIFNRYNSSMPSIDRNFETFINGIADFRKTFGSDYQVINTQMSYKFKNFTVGLNIDNLANRLYTERPALLEAPRNVSVRLLYDISEATN